MPTHFQEALVLTSLNSPLSKSGRLIPIPAPSQILVKVLSAGLNPHDQKVQEIGLFLNNTYPAILADDIAGIVTDIGPEVPGFNVGDRVFGQGDVFDHLDAGGLQQFAVLEDIAVAKIPTGTTEDEAATLPANVIAAAVALFHSEGLGIPAPFEWVGNGSWKTEDSKSLVVIGGGSNTGKFVVQLAALTGVERVIVVAGLGNEKELKGYGATHVVDRHLSDTDIKKHIDDLTNGELVYVCDTVNRDHTLAISLLSGQLKGKVVTLLKGDYDKERIGEKKAGFEINQILGSSRLKKELCGPFWKSLPAFIEKGSVKALSFQVVEGGLNAAGVNEVLEAYREGKEPGKWIVHPNTS